MNNKTSFIVGILAAIITIFVAYMAESFIGAGMNWPGAGAVFAIATMGFFIIWSNQTDNDDSDKKD
ncbi:MAG: hypothetical protein HFE78_01985 [Clostridiales bacterium]|nr:hypothetical protein [Clostridiales bacterium]